MGIVTYEVESVFLLQDEVTPSLVRIAEGFETIDNAISETQAKLDALGAVSERVGRTIRESLSGFLPDMGLDPIALQLDMMTAAADRATAAFDRLRAAQRAGAGGAAGAFYSTSEDGEDFEPAPRRRRRRAAPAPLAETPEDYAIEPYAYPGEAMPPRRAVPAGIISREGPTIDGSFDENYPMSPYGYRGEATPPGRGGVRQLGYGGATIDGTFTEDGPAALAGPGGRGGGPAGTTPRAPPPYSYTSPGGSGGGAGGGAGGRGGRGAGFVAGGAAGHAFNIFGIPEMAAEFTLFEASKQAMEVDRDIRAGRLQAGDLEGAKDSTSAGYQEAYSTVEKAQLGTVASLSEVARIYGHTRGEARGRFTDAEYNAAFRSVVNYGELSNQYTGENVVQASLSGFRDIDLFGAKTPEAARQLLGQITNLSSLSSSTANDQATVFRYAEPVAKAAGIPSADLFEYLASAQQGIGAKSTVGTGFSAFELELTEAGSHTGTRAQRARADNQARALRASLSGTDELRMHDQEHHSKGSVNKHLEGFEALGLIDAKGNRLDMTDGHVDLIKQRAILENAERTETPAEFQKNVFAAGGVRGGRFAVSVAATSDQQNTQYHTAIGGPGVDERQAIGQAAPMQQFQTAVASASTALAKIGTTLLPDLTVAFQHATHVFEAIGTFAENHPAVVSDSVGGVATIGAGMLAGKAVSAIGKVAGATLKGVGLAEAGEATAATAGVIGTMVVPYVVGGIAVALGATALAQTADQHIPFLARLDRWTGLDRGIGTASPAPAATIQPGAVQINVQVAQGTPAAMAAAISQQVNLHLETSLTRALMTDGGTAGGTMPSIFNSGGRR